MDDGLKKEYETEYRYHLTALSDAIFKVQCAITIERQDFISMSRTLEMLIGIRKLIEKQNIEIAKLKSKVELLENQRDRRAMSQYTMPPRERI